MLRGCERRSRIAASIFPDFFKILDMMEALPPGSWIGKCMSCFGCLMIYIYIYKYIVYDMPCLSVFFAPGPVTTIYLYPNILHLYDVHVWYMYRLQVGWWASHVLTMANGPCQVSSLARAALRSIEARPKDMDVGQNLENTESWWFMMIYDDLWWFMMIYDDLWWFMMIYDDLWWFMMIYGWEYQITRLYV